MEICLVLWLEKQEEHHKRVKVKWAYSTFPNFHHLWEFGQQIWGTAAQPVRWTWRISVPLTKNKTTNKWTSLKLGTIERQSNTSFIVALGSTSMDSFTFDVLTCNVIFLAVSSSAMMNQFQEHTTQPWAQCSRTRRRRTEPHFLCQLKMALMFQATGRCVVGCVLGFLITG